jgi:hypothetical protein
MSLMPTIYSPDGGNHLGVILLDFVCLLVVWFRFWYCRAVSSWPSLPSRFVSNALTGAHKSSSINNTGTSVLMRMAITTKWNA